ncbi:hypothetical protein MMC06_005268 [Schaereria dolodes]|nr:hypothetical protein [Schaereria dolodes]
MLIEESFKDVPTKAAGEGTMRIATITACPIQSMRLTNISQASSYSTQAYLNTHTPVFPPSLFSVRFTKVMIHVGLLPVPRTAQLTSTTLTGPVQRFARQIAGHGYIVAAPSSYHEFTGPQPLAYDGPGTDEGNRYKVQKKVSAYDEDAELAVSTLLSLATCNGRVGATGMCLGGHLAYRCALDKRVSAAVCYFATDLHGHSLGEGMKDNSLERAADIKGELVMIFGKKDNHVPPEGRDLIRKTLHDKGVTFSFYEVAWAQHAFIRDELSKGRYDPFVAKICFEMLLELFERTLKVDLGHNAGGEQEVEDIC